MRRYGKWAGNEKGVPENSLHCLAEIPIKGTYLFGQCSNPRGTEEHRYLCRVHAKMDPKRVHIPEDE